MGALLVLPTSFTSLRYHPRNVFDALISGRLMIDRFLKPSELAWKTLEWMTGSGEATLKRWMRK
jgi:hypothetical protein